MQKKTKKEVAPLRVVQLPSYSGFRFYQVFTGKIDPQTNEAEFVYLPSVTSILQSMAKGPGFDKWVTGLGGYDSYQKILKAAALRGSKVHNAIYTLLDGKRVEMETIVYVDEFGKEHVGMELNEWEMVIAFKNWWADYSPIIEQIETPIYSIKNGFAGTLDFVGKIKEGLINKKTKTPNKLVPIIVDWKTGGSIYDSYEYQIAAYAQAFTEITKVKVKYAAILRVSAETKSGYSFKVFSELKPAIAGFTGLLSSWKYQNPDAKPDFKEIPEWLELDAIGPAWNPRKEAIPND